MSIKFKHSILGYDPKGVEKEIEFINMEFENEFNASKRKLSKLTQQKSLLKDKILNSKVEPDSSKEIIEQISSELLETHLKLSESIYKALKCTEEIEKDRMKQISDSEKECMRIKENTRKLMEELRTRFNEY